MRWFWIDRFTEFVSGERATAIKNVSMGEEPLWQNLPGFPLFPSSLVIEGLAQTGGLLVGQQSDFVSKVVLAKVGKATFHALGRPGDQLVYRVKPVSLQEDGAVVDGTCHVRSAIDEPTSRIFGTAENDKDGTASSATGEQAGSSEPSNEQLLAEVQLVFAFLGERFEKVDLFDRDSLRMMLSQLGVFTIGVDSNGQPLAVPAHLAPQTS